MTSSKSGNRTIQGATAAVSQPAIVNANGFTLKPSQTVKSVSSMTLAPDGKLIVADWKNNALHAITLPETSATESGSFNLYGVDSAIAQALDTDRQQIRVTKSIFEPTTNKAVLAVETGAQPEDPVVIAVFGSNGEGTLHNLDELVAATLSLGDVPPEASLWEHTPARSFLVTAMKAHDGEIFVAGLANSDFSSTLRRVAYPFNGTTATTPVEIYHAVHNQIETRAPIRAFSIVDIAGAPHVLAAYTCTPLVTLPIADLKDGAHIQGKTIAELGYGNTPLDVVPFDVSYQGETSQWVMIANSSRAADLISFDAIIAANNEAGLSQPVQAPFETRSGVPAMQAPITNAVCLVDQDEQFLLSLRRDPTEGDLQLVSIRKGAFFRLSDFVNEYDFPNYSYPEEDEFQQNYIRPFHQMMKTDEGYQELVK
ncbi:MAG: hypothetical protein WA885_07155 [Phormidesmis sp.]